MLASLRRRHGRLTLAALCVVLVGLSACGGSSPEQRVRDVLERYGTALVEADGETACELHTARFRRVVLATARRAFEGPGASRLTCVSYITGTADQFYRGLSPVVTKVMTGPGPTAKGTVTWGDAQDASVITKAISLRLVGDAWRIDNTVG